MRKTHKSEPYLEVLNFNCSLRFIISVYTLSFLCWCNKAHFKSSLLHSFFTYQQLIYQTRSYGYITNICDYFM